jgi:predicted flap endonuclease-1-like 5' DNA nuclease
MNLAEDLWLRSKAAQSSMMQLMAYNTAFAGTATLQAWKMGLTAPAGFWLAMGRATGAANAAENVVALEAPAKPPRKAAKPKAKAAPVAKVAPAPEPAPEPVPAPEPEVLGPSPHLLDAPRGGKADDLTALKGVGAKLATALNEFGIYHFDQIATLDDEGIDWLNEQQNGFKMIAARYDLVAQAKARLA